MKKKLILTYLLVLSMILPNSLSHFTLQVHAEESTASLDSSNEPLEIIDFDGSYTCDEETGYISLPIDENPYPEDEDLSDITAVSSSLPSIYHPYSVVKEMYPATRNQNPYGTCWAFSTVACAEFDLITEGIFSNNGVSNFSELQLVYNMYHTGNDLFGNLAGDTITLNQGTNYLNSGGSVYYAQHILANWRGLTHEDNIDYANASTVLNSGVSSGENWNTWNNMARLENSRILDIKSNPDSVKQAIIDHGAVSASYYHNSTYYNYNQKYALYYCPTAETSNHAIAIVGWNDNLSTSLWSGCSYRPTRNGAWLVRNSWTTKTGGSESSYFWMSYEDASLDRAAYMLDFASGDNIRVSDYNYDSIYQYDGSPIHSGVTVSKIANVYTARNYYANTKGSKSETLEAIMIPFTYSYNVPLKIEIYTGLTDSSNPQSGELHPEATTYYTTDYKGIYTIKLNSPVLLAPGETYAIVVSATSGTCTFDVESSGKLFSFASVKASSKRGQSFYCTYSNWNDFYNYSSYGNICLKGLTKNSTIAKYTITYNLNGGTKVGEYPSGYTENSGSFTLPTPERAGYHFVGWYTDSNYTQKITSVSGSTGKNLVLYAKWESHNFSEQITPATLQNDGTILTKCRTCGYVSSTSTIYKPASMNLAYNTIAYTGNSMTPSVTIKDTTGNVINPSYYSVSYTNNLEVGTATVTVTFKNKYSGTMTSTFTITQNTFSQVTLAYTSCTYTGKALKPSVSVYSGSTKLSNQYYSVSYKNNKNVGTATVTITGKGIYKNYKTTKTFKINPKKFTKVTTNANTYSYTGKSVKPKVSVYVGKTKISNSYYTLSYKNNVKVGTATVTVTGKGKYANYKSSKTFKIVPKKQVITSLSTKSKTGYFYCIHTYDASASGYQAQVSTSKSFKSIATQLYMDNNYTSWYSYNLKSKKTYYVRVRSYITINGTKYYGAWSTVKSIKTR